MEGEGATRSPRLKIPMLGQPLTSREAEVAQLVGEGHTNRHIADRLGISEQTVKNHLTAVYDKTGAASRVQLALRQIRREPAN